MTENQSPPIAGARSLGPVLYGLVALIGVASVFETRLSVFAVLLLVIGLASVSSSKHLSRDRARLFIWLLSSSLVLATLGLGRFIFKEALPGISEAKGRDSSKRAVSLLREIYFAQNAARRYAMIDPDGDGIGSALRLGELSGYHPARGTTTLSTPPLSPRLAPRLDTARGPATEHDGYLILICLPEPGGTWTATVEATVDEEMAERNWLGYAWPIASGLPQTSAFAIDEHEGIYEYHNLERGDLIYVGATHPPPCDALRSPDAPQSWTAWGGKVPRTELPGERKE